MHTQTAVPIETSHRSVSVSVHSSADAVPYVADGIRAGILGAAAVALSFLALDVFSGRPLWTPSALGSALFLGERLPSAAAPVPILVLGYTAVHGAVFASLGMLASFLLMLAPPLRISETALGAVAATGLFISFQVVFLGFGALFSPRLVEALGAGPVAAANVVAAVGMAAFLVRLARSDHRPGARV
jgi:hypothetical protein